MRYLISFHVIIINLHRRIDFLVILFLINKKIKAIGEPIAFSFLEVEFNCTIGCFRTIFFDLDFVFSC